MSKYVRYKLFFFCCLPLSVVASTIPEYPITALTGTSITLDNAATFTINGIYSGITADWNPSENLSFYQTDLPFFPASISIENNLPVLEPMVYIVNVDLGTTAVGFVNTPPTVSPVTIQTINPFLGMIILSDFTSWKVSPSDQVLFSIWQIGDAVMIGENLGSDRATYDAILLNTIHKSTAHAVQH